MKRAHGDCVAAAGALCDLPRVPWRRSTVPALELEWDGLLRRYVAPDDFQSEEDAFLACSFWLVKCLARAGKREEAEEVFRRTVETSNDLGTDPHPPLAPRSL